MLFVEKIVVSLYYRKGGKYTPYFLGKNVTKISRGTKEI